MKRMERSERTQTETAKRLVFAFFRLCPFHPFDPFIRSSHRYDFPGGSHESGLRVRHAGINN
jgi:hypothetical protein